MGKKAEKETTGEREIEKEGEKDWGQGNRKRRATELKRETLQENRGAKGKPPRDKGGEGSGLASAGSLRGSGLLWALPNLFCILSTLGEHPCPRQTGWAPPQSFFWRLPVSLSPHKPRRPEWDPVCWILVTTLHYAAGASLSDKGVTR